MSASVVRQFASKMSLGDRDDVVRDAARIAANLQASSKLTSVATASGIAVVALRIAADRAEAAVEVKKLHKLAGVGSKSNFLKILKLAQSEVGVEAAAVTVDEVAVKMGCSQVRQKARDMLQAYKKDFLAKLSSSRRQDMDFGKAVYTCAAVAAAAKTEGAGRVDRAKLAEVCGETKAAVDKVVKEILEVDEKVEADKRRCGRKRKAANDDDLMGAVIDVNSESDENGEDQNGTNEEKAESDDEFDPREYEVWKRSMLKKAGLIK